MTFLKSVIILRVFSEEKSYFLSLWFRLVICPQDTKKAGIARFFIVNFLKLFLLNFFVGFHFASSFGAAAFHAI